MTAKKLVLYLHGGLGDQLRKYFAGLYLSQRTNRELIFDTSFQHEWHIGDVSSLSFLFENIPVDNNVLASRERYRFALRRSNKLLSSRGYIDSIFSYFQDFDNSSFDVTLNRQEIIAKLEAWRRRSVIAINGYFPTFTYFREVAKNSNVNFKLMTIPRDFQNKCIIHFRTGDSYPVNSEAARDLFYYESAIARVRSFISDIEFYGIADNVPIAKVIYANLKIQWVDDSDKWDSYKLFSVLSHAQYFISSQSGISLWALAVSPMRKMSILPKVSDSSELGRMIKTGDFSKSIFIPSNSL